MPGDLPTAASTPGREADVVVVGGGPAGCAAAVFTARYGLETLVFDRGSSSLRRCAHLENYLGFPAGIDVETFAALARDHAETAGCDVVEDLVETVSRPSSGGDAADSDRGPFVVETQDGRTVRARWIVAATRYDGEYLRPLVGADGFVAEHGDERFDRDYAGTDGSTPIAGLFVASPSHAADRQVLVAAGRGARVGLAVVGAARHDVGYPEAVATHYDWVRRDADRGEEWRDRDRWRDLFEDRLPADHDLADAQRQTLREREIDRRLATYRTDEEIDAAARRGQRRLLDHLADDLVLERARDIQAEREAVEAGD